MSVDDDIQLSLTQLVADFAGATINGTNLTSSTLFGFTKEQFYSTANYQSADLREVIMEDNDLTGWNLSGQNLTNADFNDDGFDDLAIGIPRFGLTTVPTASGAVGVTPGGASGLQISGSQLWTQDGGVDDQGNSLGDLPSTSATGDQFGRVLP